eukprot:scaffold15633_cov60-Phaeocystis_antarctica.AAC.3
MRASSEIAVAPKHATATRAARSAASVKTEHCRAAGGANVGDSGWGRWWGGGRAGACLEERRPDIALYREVGGDISLIPCPQHVLLGWLDGANYLRAGVTVARIVHRAETQGGRAVGRRRTFRLKRPRPRVSCHAAICPSCGKSSLPPPFLA